MSQTDNLGSMDFDNPALRELVERQMSSMSAMRSLNVVGRPGRSPKAVQRLEGQDRVRGRIGKRHSLPLGILVYHRPRRAVRGKLFRDTVAVNNIHHSTNRKHDYINSKTTNAYEGSS